MGKAIYKPVGKAQEYSRWACNFFLGCSNDCDYCYCKKGVLGTVAGGNKPMLKKCFKDINDAFSTFMEELQKNADDIRKEGGLFFSFTSDPCLPETVDLTVMSVMFATGMDIPCHILTKCVKWLEDENIMNSLISVKDKVAIGFTLTGMDEMERGPTIANNTQRVQAMAMLHTAGFKTFASMEPVVDIIKAYKYFNASKEFCNLYKIGLLSGKNDYDRKELLVFIDWINSTCEKYNTHVYWKKSVKTICGNAAQGKMCVDETFSLFP